MKGEQRQELHIKDMLYTVAKGWRLLVVCGVIAAVLLAGFKFLMDTKSSNAQTNQPQTTVTREDLEEQLTKTQLVKVQEAEALRTLIEEKDAYFSASPYLAIDPYKEHLVTLMYYVDTQNHLDFAGGVITGDGGELAKAYTQGINNCLYEAIDGELAGYYNQVISAALIEESIYQFTVQIKSATEEQAKQLAQKVKPVVATVQDNLSRTMDAHSLRLVDETYSLTVDSELADKKEAFILGLNRNKTDLNTLVDGFSTAQRELYDWEDAPEVQTDQPAEPAKTAPSLSVKYLVLGGILGVMAAAAILVLGYMMGCRLRSPQELEEIYSLAQLGTLSVPAKKRIFGFVDRLMDRCFVNENWSDEQRLAFTLSNVKLLCRKEEINELTLAVNFDLTQQEQGMVEGLQEQLLAAGIRTQLCRNIHKDAQQFEEVYDIGKVLFLEKQGVSCYSDIQRQIALCRQSGVAVLGAVTFVQ